MTTQVIKSKTQHEKYLAEAEYLISLDPEPGTTKGDRLELLSILIEKYEKENFPIDKPDPIEAIEFRMEQQGLKQKDLVPYIGSKSKVSEVLSRKRPLTLQMVRNLNQGLGIPTDVLVQDLSNFSSENGQTDWSKYPIREMVKRNWIDASLEEIKEKGSSLIKKFFSFPELKSSTEVYFRQSYHERSNKKMDYHALQAWIAQVLHRTIKEGPKKEYAPNSIDDDFMKEIAKLSYFEKGPLLAQEFLAKHGIALVIEAHLPKTHLDGASMLGLNNNPVIGMTLRHDRLDNFWFTLMHELSHIRLHIQDRENIFIDDLDLGSSSDPLEEEADDLAGETLISRRGWKSTRAYQQKTESAVIELAEALQISPAIVAGKIRFETNDYSILNKLTGNNKVRALFKSSH